MPSTVGISRKLTGTSCLVVDAGTVHMWPVRHRHTGNENTPEGCRTVLALRRVGTDGRLEIAFRDRPAGSSPAGTRTRARWPPSRASGRPSTSRELPAAWWTRRRSGICCRPRGTTEVDGWVLYDAVLARVSAAEWSTTPAQK
ncbi:hypothetical protein ABZ208_25070 [Streptomyces sp. NPDC006208]|uniref:hypothetical protein n=1 Tax=Streptomyces sp. NPDC006208 TaxID=3156734 RepID=UPI0033B2832F